MKHKLKLLPIYYISDLILFPTGRQSHKLRCRFHLKQTQNLMFINNGDHQNTREQHLDSEDRRPKASS